jgi:hypothetical protein
VSSAIGSDSSVSGAVSSATSVCSDGLVALPFVALVSAAEWAALASCSGAGGFGGRIVAGCRDAASAASDSKKRIAAGGLRDSPTDAPASSTGSGAGGGGATCASPGGVIGTVARQLQHVNDVPPAGIRVVSIWYFRLQLGQAMTM